jgi:hypothetical protein
MVDYRCRLSLDKFLTADESKTWPWLDHLCNESRERLAPPNALRETRLEWKREAK